MSIARISSASLMERSTNKFRLSSRELFNNYFLESLSDDQKGWDYLEQFDFVAESLFLALVTVPNGLDEIVYGRPQPQILVKTSSEVGAPLILNREIDSGYWDYPVTYSVPNAVFTFVRFFDWNQMSYKDNRFVQVVVRDWPGNTELVGKHALLETHYVTYEKA